MRVAITSAVISICMVLTIALIMTINNSMVRKNEIEETLSVAMDSAMDSLKYSNNGYAINDYESLISDLNQNILLQVTSNSDITIKVLYTDLENGIIDVEATQKYKWAGKDKEISVRKTIILDEYVSQDIINEEILCTVTFKVDNKVYSEQNVSYGEVFKKPEDPTIAGHKFIGWYVYGDDSKNVITNSEWEDFCVAEDVTFIASFVEI
jgi:hypothetical protein